MDNGLSPVVSKTVPVIYWNMSSPYTFELLPSNHVSGMYEVLIAGYVVSEGNGIVIPHLSFHDQTIGAVEFDMQNILVSTVGPLIPQQTLFFSDGTVPVMVTLTPLGTPGTLNVYVCIARFS